MGHKAAFKKLYKTTKENQKIPLKDRPIPIAAVIHGSNIGKVLACNNSKTITGSEEQVTHAEHHLVSELKKILKNKDIKLNLIKILITIPPCEICLEELYNIGITKIYYVSNFSLNSKASKYETIFFKKIKMEKMPKIDGMEKEIEEVEKILERYITYQYIIRWANRILKKDIVKLKPKDLDYMKIINKDNNIFQINENLLFAKFDKNKLKTWIKKTNKDKKSFGKEELKI